MRRSPVVLAVTLSTLAMLPGAGAAQDAPIVFEVAGGAAVPVGSFADGTGAGEGAEAGASLSVNFVLPRSGRPSIYLGFSQHRFGCTEAGCADGGEYVATGFNVGVRFTLLRGHTAVPWIRLGGITTRVETPDLPAPDTGVSDLGFGGEAGVGVYVGWERIAIQPMLTFSTVGSTLPGGETLGLRFLTGQLAVAFPF